MARRILLLLVASAASVLLFASPVSAHNTLLSSDPAEGAVLGATPTQVTLVFAKSVPLETLSMEMIDPSGVRTDLGNFAHGPTGDTEVVTPLPPLPPGAVTLRWRLVGSDGHPITGRINFSISTPATVPPTTASPTTASPTIVPATTTPTATSPAVVVPSTAAPTNAPVAVPATTSAEASGGFQDPWSTSTAVRWFFRFGSYVAIMVIGGVLATTAFVWNGAWNRPVIRKAVAWSLAATLFGTIAQLLIIASDIKATPPWASVEGVSAAISTDAGTAFAIRIVLVGTLAWSIFVARTASDESRWVLSVVLLVLLFATWAFAGHSRSMRWSLIGVPVDVAHHAAAAAWIGGLAIIGMVAIKACTKDELIQTVAHFARLASTAVTVIVVTGVVQAIRLVGSPGQLFAANHGKYLILKVIVLGAMLKIADINRQRVNRRLKSAATASRLVVGNLRRAMGTEFAVGVLIVAVTAAMVVSPPAVADDDSRASELNAPSNSAVDLPTSSTASPTTAASITCMMSGSPIRLGDVGSDVECLQSALRASGLLASDVTGDFDVATDLAVREFQTQRGLEVDGIVGQVTATALGIWQTT